MSSLDGVGNAQFPKKAMCLFKPAPYKVFYGGRGGSKCLGLGTRVIMADGTLRVVEDVCVGDQVMGPDSRPRNVLSVTRGAAPLFRVKQTSGIDYVVNDAHILSLKKSKSSERDVGELSRAGNPRRPRGRYPGWPDIVNINVELAAAQSQRWRSNFRGYRAGVIAFPAQPVTIDPYFLGIWLGDGLHRELMITNADEEVITACREYAATFGLGFSRRTGSSGAASDITFPPQGRRDNPLWGRFKAYLLVRNKHIPAPYIVNSETVRLALLAGLIDSDGSVHNNCYAISQVNELLARQIKYVADTLGFRTSLVKRRTVCVNNGAIGHSWYVSICGDIWRIPCRVPRKRIAREAVRKNKDFLLSQISIEPLGVGEYAGFAIDGDHLFLLEDGTVTHNTWDFCRALLILGAQRKLFILCAREIQKSISESVHRTLSEQIHAMGLWKFYRVMERKIVGENGTQFVFAGIRNNVTAIKSMEGVDICAVFEATFVSEHSWSVLLPTIRKDAPFGPFGKGSEIWVEFNPELDTDYTYKYWVQQPPAGTVVVNINWRDNYWFPDFLRKQKDDLRERDPDSYLTVWEGHTRRILQGAIYAKELEKAQKDGRVNAQVLVDRSKPVDISADLGRADTTSLTFWQQVGMEHRAVDYYGNFGFEWAHYLEEIQNRRLIVGRIYLPHDADNKVIQAAKSIKRQTMDAYPGENRVILVPRTTNIVNDINVVRNLFPRMWFNELKCADLLTALAHYRYEVDPETREVSKYPLHDWASHAADSVRTYAMGLRAEGVQKMGPQKHMPRPLESRRDGLGWLAG